MVFNDWIPYVCIIRNSFVKVLFSIVLVRSYYSRQKSEIKSSPFPPSLVSKYLPVVRPISGDGAGPSVTRLSSPRQWEPVSLRLRAERPRRSRGQWHPVIIKWFDRDWRIRHLTLNPSRQYLFLMFHYAFAFVHNIICEAMRHDFPHLIDLWRAWVTSRK